MSLSFRYTDEEALTSHAEPPHLSQISSLHVFLGHFKSLCVCKIKKNNSKFGLVEVLEYSFQSSKHLLLITLTNAGLLAVWQSKVADGAVRSFYNCPVDTTTPH